MDSLGEVGKKMRSAIKAKLLELGTGSQTGYIDDELPDYVMIMVANKRSKSQMQSDLNLFLGSNTESFVNWLHQVLQKLQEVTLPNNLASKAKRKVAETSSKKDKKKDKKKGNKEPSITDVIAVELMEKAKKTLESDPSVKNEGRTPSPPPAPSMTSKVPHAPSPPRLNSPSGSEKEDDEFDIPTISEIKTTSGDGNLHKKELSQLQELQNRIYQTKKKLRDLDSESDEESVPVVKSTVLSRLGVKPTENSKPSNIISLSAIRRTEKEIYVAPSFRQLIVQNKVENDRRGDRRDQRQPLRRPVSRRERRSRSRSRSRERHRGRRDRSRSPIRSRSPRNRPSIHQRIGSRVVVASPEKEVVKAKQRPALSSAITGQAGKNLLLRAVAEAQRSTSGSQKKPPRDNIVVQVPLRKDKRNIRIEEEYVPESISTQSESEAEYHPTYSRNVAMDEGTDEVIFNEEVDLEDLDNDEPRKSPQFVVTLEGAAQYEENSKSSHSPTPPPVIKRKSIKDRIGFKGQPPQVKPSSWEDRQATKRKQVEEEKESESQRAYNRAKRARVSPIKFDLTDEENDDRKSRGDSKDRGQSHTPERKSDDDKKNDQNGEEQAKRIRLETSRSFDHVPALLSSIAVPVPDTAKPIVKSKERCKYYPSCSNTNCAFFHPTQPCKLFPNCKFADSCVFVHPRCKFDLSCARGDCNFSHSQAGGTGLPPIASSIVPVSNYKSISINPTSMVCKFFPDCKNTNCLYLRPKICKYGKGCLNKFDCNFYHFETASHSKFKWISPLS